MDAASLIQQCYALIQAGEAVAGQQLYQAMMSGDSNRIAQQSSYVTKLLEAKATGAPLPTPVAAVAEDQGSSSSAAVVNPHLPTTSSSSGLYLPEPKVKRYARLSHHPLYLTLHVLLSS